MPLADENVTRIESFPFDSKLDGYDDNGYPVYDRAVGAATLRNTFRQFFSNGLFGTPSNAFTIQKLDGLRVSVQPGMGIINGAMGGITDTPLTVTLDTAAPQGLVSYGIFLRYDENDDKRSMYVRVGKGAPGGEPPAVDASPGVMELRVGNVKVPSGATDLSGATITDERGTAVCPYAAPFVKIDVSALLESIAADAQKEVDALRERLDKYDDLIQSAIDGTVAGQLQGQINDLTIGMTDAEFESYVLSQDGEGGQGGTE